MEPTAKRSSQGMMCILLFVMITTLSISPSNALRCSIGFITPSSLDHIPAGTASCNPGNGERTCTLSSCHGSGPTGTMLLSSFVFHDCEDEFEKKKGLTIYPTSFDEANNELAVHGREHPTGNIGTYYCTMKSNPYRPCEFCFNHTEPFLSRLMFSLQSVCDGC
ncbi:hypothetical protein KEM48_011688 [Puccinia striiformis f. sp. tritici PST-130]|nr:hypothetical protein KEM48_011688 [Puccinia striiformis f. sp. tritici PST-130]